MLFSALLLTFGATFVAAIEGPFFRWDYSYVNQFDAFYKLHWSRNGTNWTSAYLTCEDEESSLFYPKEEGEWTVVNNLLTRRLTRNVSDILVGIRDEFGFGTFTTVEGSQFTSEIANDQPTIDGPACVIMNIDSGSFKALKCDTTNLHFVCKKQFTIELCPTVDTGYTYNEVTRKCYKIHEKKKNWIDAKQTCALEGGSLLLIKNSAEATIIRQRISPVNNYYLVGFRRLLYGGDFYTVGGQIFDDTFYKNWWTSNADTSKHCGTILLRPNILNTHTIECLKPEPFVCEMVPKTFKSLNSWRSWVNQGTEPPASMTNRGALEAEPALSGSVSVAHCNE